MRDGIKKKELERKNKVDPQKIKFFKKMKEDTKKKVLELKTNYDRSLSKSLQKQRRGGSLASYLASDVEKNQARNKKQIDTSTSSTYIASELNADQ